MKQIHAREKHIAVASRAALVPALVLLVAAQCAVAGDPAVGYEQRSVAGVSAHVITVDLSRRDVKVSVTVARGGFPHANESFADMVSRARPVAAINGTFFDKHTLKPIGDIVISGDVVHQGLMGTALAITVDNEAVIRRVTWGHAENWSRYETVLACGPTLVKDGRIDLDPGGERFRDPHVLGDGCRSACGLTSEGKLRLVSVTQAISLRTLADLMLKLGCSDAMNLDGGASTAMYYRGRTIVSPGRKLTNVLTVYEDRTGEAAVRALVAEGMRRKSCGHYSAAVAIFRDAVQAASDCVSAHWALAWTLAESGRRAEAIEHFRAVIRLAPEGARADEARAAIQRLR